MLNSKQFFSEVLLLKFTKFRKLKACQKSKEEKMDDKILYRGKKGG